MQKKSILGRECMHFFPVIMANFIPPLAVVYCTTRKKSEICTPIRNPEFVLHIFALTRKQVFCISPGFHISKLQSELTMHADQVHVKHPISGIFRRACGALADTSRPSSKESSAASTIPSSAARGTSSCSRTGPPSPTTSTSRSSTMRSTVGIFFVSKLHVIQI